MMTPKKPEAVLFAATFTLDNIPAGQRATLNRRILALAELSADRVGSQRERVVAGTLSRFDAWITPGKDDPRLKPWLLSRFRSLLGGAKAPPSDPHFEERWRVESIDQGIRFAAVLETLQAVANNAVAVEWHSHCQRMGYDINPEHKKRDKLIYAVRGSWAMKKKLIKAGKAGLYEDVTPFGFEPGCQCYGRWIYNMRDLPDDMITKKGKKELARVRAQIAGLTKMPG